MGQCINGGMKKWNYVPMYQCANGRMKKLGNVKNQNNEKECQYRK